VRERPSAREIAAELRMATSVGVPAEARAFLAGLFPGVAEEETRARAALEREPTAVRAAAMPSMTAFEDTPPSGVEVDAETKMTIGVRRHAGAAEETATTDAPRPLFAAQAETQSVQPARPPGEQSRSMPSPRPRSPWTIAGATAATALIAGIVTFIVIPAPAHVDPIVESPAPVFVSEPLPPPRPVTEPPPAPSPPAPEPPAAPPEPTPALPPPTTTDSVETQEASARRRPTRRSTSSGLFGDRIRALKACASRPACAAGVIERSADVTALSVEELRDLDADLDRCLQRCR
jgi:hypothetical protein